MGEKLTPPGALLGSPRGQADEIDWDRASLYSARSVPAKGGGRKPARIRRIEANQDQSATLFGSATTASRWP